MRTQASKLMAWELSEALQIIWTRGLIKSSMQFKVARVWQNNHFFSLCQPPMAVNLQPNLSDLELFAAIPHQELSATNPSKSRCQKFCLTQPFRQILCKSPKKVNFLVQVSKLKLSKKQNWNFHSRPSVRKFYSKKESSHFKMLIVLSQSDWAQSRN